MADFIQFTGPIKPLGSATFALLSDAHICGSFKIVSDEAARDALDPTTLKVGTLVKCLSSGIYWRAKNVSVGYDEFDDPDLVAALTQKKAHHGNPSGMVTPVDSGDEQQNHDKDALSEVKPIQIHKTSDHLGKNVALSLVFIAISPKAGSNKGYFSVRDFSVAASGCCI